MSKTATEISVLYRLLLTAAATILTPLMWAQMPAISSTTSTPVPGVGHDYLGSIVETVNPAIRCVPAANNNCKVWLGEPSIYVYLIGGRESAFNADILIETNSNIIATWAKNIIVTLRATLR